MASSSSDGFGGDYSFLLQSIEEKISENMKGGEVSGLFGSPMPEYSSAVKRRRESGAPTPSMDYNFGSAKKLRSMMEMDEVVLENEQLKDQLQRLKSESQIAREEQIRQIKFLDERCTSFKKESAERLEKYYEEKKKWQSKQRETELLLKKAVEKASTPAPPAPTGASSSANNDIIVLKLRTLEKDLMTKVSEAKNAMQDKLTLETQLYEANLELKELRAAQGAGSMNGEAMNEARTLRKQFSELETVYKRMAREHEVMKLKMKNQGLLEEEVSTFRAKLRIAEETVSALKHIQAEHQQLQGEKVLWSQLFQEILQEAREADHSALLAGEDGSLLDVLSASSSSNSSASSSPSVAPAQVLRVLSAYQRQCAVLLQGQGQLQQAQAEVRRQLREAIKTQRAAEDESVRLSDELEKMEGQLRSATQHSRLYTNEISTLRAMLATYDSEFSIGKPDTTKMFALKDQLISELRSQLDASRSETSMSGTKARLLEARVEELEGAVAAGQEEARRLQDEVAAATSAASRAKEELEEQMQTASSSASEQDAEQLAVLKAQAEEAQEQLAYFQYATGLDYLPDRTRVLHMPLNPSSHVPLVNSVPSVAALKELRVETLHQVRTLQQQLQQCANSNSSSSEGGEDARSTSTGSAGDDADQSVLGRAGHHQNLNMSVLEAHQGAVSSSSGGSHAACPASCASAVALRNSEKLNLRLKEMFKERISSFREGVYLLTGYKVELIGADSLDSLPRLRLRSMFAERPEDTLMFQLRGDAPELMETEFASRLEPHLLHHLQVTNSVPAFLASVTLDLFESQTFMG